MSFKIVQANVQHGTGTDGVVDFPRQTAILTAGIDIICMQERTTSSTGWDASMTAAGFSEAIYRENDPSQNDGPSIWVKTPTVTVNGTPFQHDLSEGAIGWNGTTNVDKAAVGVNVTVTGGYSFYVFCTHLAWSAGADSDGSTFSAIRVAQINELHSWINGIVGTDPNVLIVGDMNFGPDYPKSPSGLQIDPFLASYSDLWVQGMSEGKATAAWGDRNTDGTPDMPITNLTTRTHDTRRIDYFFLKFGAGMTMDAIDLPDLRTTCSGGLTGSPAFCPDTSLDQRAGTPDDFGVKPSDHNWMIATFTPSNVRVRRKLKMVAQ